LIEVSGDVNGPSAAVIGLGINVRLDEAAKERIGQPASDLAQCGEVIPSRSVLLAMLLERLAPVLAQFAREGFAAFRREWLRRHAWQGRQVALELAGRRIAEGRIVDIAEDGALMLASPGGVERFHSGELSLRQR
jgi:BirA family biotin operon repressor/biotin-[acetyl-CoA-carboxylase] ligase